MVRRYKPTRREIKAACEFYKELMSPVKTCGKLIQCFDNIKRPCVRQPNHTSGCNPFSDSDPIPEQPKKDKPNATNQ